MSISPTFVASMAVLKQRLRLTGVKSDGEIIIEDAIESARLEFYTRLGISRVTTLLGYSYSEATPTTNEEILRSLANQTETRLVKRTLLRSMGILLKDGAASGREMWNQESIFRDKTSSELNEELRRLTSEIEDAFDLLSGSEDVGNTTSARISVIEPDTPGPRPGHSLNMGGSW